MRVNGWLRKLFVLGAFLLLCSTANAFYFPDSYDLEFNEELKRPGAKEIVVTFYSIEEKFGEKHEVPQIKLLCKYNENGNIVQMTSYTYRTRYSKTKGNYLIIDETFSERYRYAYDDKGRMIEKRKIDKSSNEPDFWQYVYDDKEILLEKKRIDVFRAPDRVFELNKYKYNNDGALVEREQFDQDGDREEKEIYTYDSKGNCIQEVRKQWAAYQNSYEDRKTLTNTYDERNRKIKTDTNIDAEGELRFIAFEYNDKNKVAKETYYVNDPRLAINRDGSQVPPKPGPIILYDYDDKVNIIERSTLDSRGGEAFAVKAEYKYDETGKVLEGKSISIRQGEDGKAVETPIGFYKVEYK